MPSIRNGDMNFNSDINFLHSLASLSALKESHISERQSATHDRLNLRQSADAPQQGSSSWSNFRWRADQRMSVPSWGRPQPLFSPQHIASERHILPQGIVESFSEICNRWSIEESQAAVLIGLEDNVALGKEVLRGAVLPFTRDIEDRMAILVGISIGLGTLFDESVDEERRWLNTNIEEILDSPIRFMLEGSMRNLLVVSEIVLRIRGV